MNEAEYMRTAASRAFEALEKSFDEVSMAKAMEMCVRFFPIDTIDTQAAATDDVRRDAGKIREILESANDDDAIEDEVDGLWEGIVAAERSMAARGYATCAVLLETVIEPLLDETLNEMTEDERHEIAGILEDEHALRGELLSRSRRAQALLFGI